MLHNKRPVVLIIRDGWGHNPFPEFNDFNAVYLASTPVNDRLLREFPHTQIHTSGEDVGLPKGTMGNSEVGHQNIGAGRIVNQELMRITQAIRDGSLFGNQTLKDSVAHISRTGGSIHLLGLLSDGGVHSHFDHAVALVDFYKRANVGVDKVVAHIITDGRDTAPNSGLEFVKGFEQEIQRIGLGRIGSVIGRFYAMDRDFRWDRVSEAYKLLVNGGELHSSATAAVSSYYDSPTSSNQSGDEFITPASVGSDSQRSSNRVQSGDAVIFFNYRGDRPRELTKAFVLDDKEWETVPKGGFERGSRLDDLFFATMAEYEKGLPTRVVFPAPERLRNTLGEVLANSGLKQLRCAESEKHPHVTYFFNDYRIGCFSQELQLDIPSPKHVPTYDLLPEMSSIGVTDAVVNAIRSQIFDFILVNFANGDMVGHTGVLGAAIDAVEAVDAGVGRIVDASLEHGGAAIVTADHGNCEQMFDPETGGPHTKHTTYDVDLIVVDKELRGSELRVDGRLADVAPTVLQLLGLVRPKEMTGRSLIMSTDSVGCSDTQFTLTAVNQSLTTSILLDRLAKSETPRERQQCAAALAEVAKTDSSTVAAICDSLSNDPDGGVRGHCAALLGQLGVTTATIPLLRSLFGDDEPEVRELAASALGKLADPRAVPGLITGLKSDPDKGTRDACYDALRQIDDEDARIALRGGLTAEQIEDNRRLFANLLHSESSCSETPKRP